MPHPESMPRFEECFLLLPSSTLEDFPKEASAVDARNLLAAWTVLWHPRLIASTQQSPTWYRADSPPEPSPGRLVVVPNLSQQRLVEGYESRCRATENCVWLEGNTRAEMLAALSLSPNDSELLATADRCVSPEDFFALGYAMLQVQVMTRRLRYTSNLDEIHFQKRLVAAAVAYVAGDASATIESLHFAFDSLAEERDHYFSNDPSLIDLTLLTPSTISSLAKTSSLVDPAASSATSDESSSGSLATPMNVLTDAAVIESLAGASGPTDTAWLIEKLRSREIGWAAGGPAANVVFDTLTYREGEQQLTRAFTAALSAVGVAPQVYGRLAGSTPADLTPCLVDLGYKGMMPIDFTGGTGFGDESKVMRREGGAEIEALAARPIDASNDASFLSLAPRLGEMIDAGEIATGLLVHWPGNVCDSFLDLRRLATWSLVLGRFWTLDKYFTDGEHPYHHSGGRSQSPEAAESLTSSVARNLPDPISSVVRQTHQSVASLRDELLRGMLALVTGKTPTSTVTVADLAVALGATPSRTTGKNAVSKAAMVLNPFACAHRGNVPLTGAAVDEEHVFAASREQSHTVITMDVPAAGFASIKTASGIAGEKVTSGSASWIPSFLRTQPARIAEGNSLRNEFMDVTIDPKSGGIQGVYSGGTRGNRMSMRLVVGGQETTLQCDQLHIAHSHASTGMIETSGSMLGESGEVLATFQLAYTLDRGSRLMRVQGEIKPLLTWMNDPWKSYLAARVAVSSDTANTRVILRDKLHRTTGRRWVAPLGLEIDENERRTLVASAGLAFHRRVQDRFIDTLICVAGETSTHFSLHYGFDVPQPVETAKSVVAPPLVQAIEHESSTNSGWPSRGWLVHTAPKDVSMISLEPQPGTDSNLMLRMRVVRTRSTGGTTTLRFCRDVLFATVYTPELSTDLLGAATIATREPSAADKRFSLTVNGDAVRVTLSGHQILELLVVIA